MIKLLKIALSLSIIVALAISTLLYLQKSKDLDIAKDKINLVDNKTSELERMLEVSSVEISTLQSILADKEEEIGSLYESLKQILQENLELQETKSEWEFGYNRIRKEISKKLGTGADAMEYITPEDELVKYLAKSIAGDLARNWDEYSLDIRNLYFWVKSNIKYNSDSLLPIIPDVPTGKLSWKCDYWRTPRETIQDGIGDCEDMACLLSSLILSYNNNQFVTWVIGIHSGNIGHMAVAIPVNDDRLIILDPTGHYTCVNNSGGISSKPVDKAISEWLNHCELSGMLNASIDIIFDNNNCINFTNTNDFLSWFAK